MKSLPLFLLIPCFASPSFGLIAFNRDNFGVNSNTTDPGTGVPWDAVAKLTNAGATSLSGTAVYIGDRWMLTANHVSSTHVTFDGTTTIAVEGGSPAQVATNVDLKVFRLVSDPGVAGVPLLNQTLSLGDGITYVGWGRGRDEGTSSPGDAVQNWGTNATSTRRWGTNQYSRSVLINYQAGNYSALATHPGDNLGDDEASLTIFDSGSAAFVEIAFTWYLAGINTAVGTNNTSTFAEEDLSDFANLLAPGDYGDENYSASVAAYRQEILAAIPEPGVAAGVVLFGASLALRRRTR